ncbi:MAG: hypothetical protein WC414_01015 [Patescibacteria group bacterium]
MEKKTNEKTPESSNQNGSVEATASAGTTTIEEQEALAGQETIMPGEEPAVKTEPKLETKPEHELTEMQKLDELLKSVEKFAEREAKFNNTVFPVVDSINVKSWWIIGFSVFTLITIFVIAGITFGMFSENEAKVAEISQSLASYNEAVVEFTKTTKKEIAGVSEKVDKLSEKVDKKTEKVMSWLRPAGEMLDKHEKKFLKMSREVSYLKDRKLEEIKKAEEEAKKSLEIENPPAVDDLPAAPTEEKKEEPAVSPEDSGKTADSGKTVMIGKAMPEVDKSDDSEGELKITIRKIKK